jgi:hypothetical protein
LFIFKIFFVNEFTNLVRVLQKPRRIIKPLYFYLTMHFALYFYLLTYLIAFYSLRFALRSGRNTRVVMTRVVNFSHACTEHVKYDDCNVVQHRKIPCVIVRIVRRNPFTVTSSTVVPYERWISMKMLSNNVIDINLYIRSVIAAAVVVRLSR